MCQQGWFFSGDSTELVESVESLVSLPFPASSGCLYSLAHGPLSPSSEPAV